MSIHEHDNGPAEPLVACWSVRLPLRESLDLPNGLLAAWPTGRVLTRLYGRH